MRTVRTDADGVIPSDPVVRSASTDPVVGVLPDGSIKVSHGGPIESVGVMGIPASDSFNRPSNTDPYTAGDEISTTTNPGTTAYLTFEAMTRSGENGSGYITKARLRKSKNDINNATFRLYLFDGTPAVVGDANAFTVANDAALIGWFDFEFETLGVKVAFGEAAGGGGPLAFYSSDGDGRIFGVLVATGAYTPASGETFDIELTPDQN